MNMKNYIIEFENYEDFTLGDFIEVIRKTEGIPLNELKVKDLTYYNDELIEGGCGVYIFKEKEDIILVGKAEIVSFTERIAKHFDLRTNAWFNRLLYVISMKKLGFEAKDEKSYREASKYAFNNCSLVLINIKNNSNTQKPSKISILETVLRGSANPLNKFKNKTFDTNKKLKDMLGII